MKYLLTCLTLIMLYPSYAYARYGRSSDGGWIFILIIVLIFILICMYLYIASNEKNKAEKRYNAILKYETEKIKNELEEKNLIIIKKLKKYEEQLIFTKKIQDKLFEEKTKGFPWVAEAYSRFYEKKLEEVEKYLLNKKNPAYKSAEIVKELKSRIKESEKKSFTYKGIVDYYENLFPWLHDFINAPDEIIDKSNHSDYKESEIDPAQNFLSSSEWKNLPISERFQIALNRYWNRHKTNWEIGRDYERFIGYEYEMDGWDVTFEGAIKGFEDMGRDLICKKDNEICIIQCKRWSSEKTIHEKHIFQLFGSCVEYGIKHGKRPSGILITSCKLSDMAKKCAKALKIIVIENKPMMKYPSIKCNINNEKIYHLPFDQMYDKVKINRMAGEIYVDTIEKAEQLGFRRAFRWHGNS